jgi:hypothetical protein
MIYFRSTIIFSLLLITLSYAAVSYKDYKVVKFKIENKEQLKKCEELEFSDGVRILRIL